MEKGSCRHLHTLLGEHGADELVPFRHAGTFLGHVVPAIIVFRTDVLQRVVLQAVADVLRNACLTGQCLEGATEISVRRVRDHATVSLAPHETVERAVADGL